MKLGVYIPGRLSSGRLPNKLIRPIGDTCLWEIACKKLEQLPDKYGKYALAFDEELLNISRNYNITTIVRDKDTAKQEGPLNYIFKEIKDVPETHLMFLNPCIAFITVDTIVKSLEKFENENMDYATSVKPFQNWLWDPNGTIMTPIDYERLTTKEIEPMWQTAHCFHMFNKDKFFEDGMMLKQGHGLLPMPIEETIDVDTILDYQFAKWKYELR